MELKEMQEQQELPEIQELAYNKCYNANILRKKGEKLRIPELEVIIAKNPVYSFQYARDIIKGRWEEGEGIIATDPELSYCYAKHVIEGPFPLGHHVIFKSEWKKSYINYLKYLDYDLTEISEWLI
jgi:hypothetical protein